MKILFSGFRSGTIKTLTRRETDPESRTQEFHDKLSALRFLRRFIHDTFIMASLRKFLVRDAYFSGVFRMSDHDVLEQIAEQLVSGRTSISMLPIREELEFSAGAESAKSPPPPAAGKRTEPVVEEEEKKTSWIEIELVGMDSKPVAGERYEITLPDGKTIAGKLDQNGFARETGFEAGSCRVCFPDLDREAWEKA